MIDGALDGILPVDKPVGPTSHDIVTQARRALGRRRIGHTGTLDPFASGLMLLCIGRATRLAEYLTGMDKTYTATVRLGVSTDTLDLDGEVTAVSDDWARLNVEVIEAAASPLRGAILQVPPQFSAKKVDGVAMHRRARRGEVVHLEPRPVTVHELTIESIELPDVRFTCRCSSGTYVRSLARDLGEALGVGGHLTELRRTSVGDRGVASSLTLAELGDPARVRGAWLNPLESLAHLPRIDVDGASVEALGHGKAVAVPDVPDSPVAAVAAEGRLVAVGVVADGFLRPRKVFVG